MTSNNVMIRIEAVDDCCCWDESLEVRLSFEYQLILKASNGDQPGDDNDWSHI